MHEPRIRLSDVNQRVFSNLSRHVRLAQYIRVIFFYGRLLNKQSAFFI